MEAGNRAACDRDEHIRPDRSALGVKVLQRNLGNRIFSAREEDSADDCRRHDDQQNAENWIELADELVDGEEGSEQVVDENYYRPEGAVHPIGSQLVEQTRGTCDEYRAAQHEQNHRENSHYPFGDLSEICARKLGDRRAFVT